MRRGRSGWERLRGWGTTGRDLEHAPGASSALLLFLPVAGLCVPIEEELAGDEAVAERRDHEGARHERVSRLLRNTPGDPESVQGRSRLSPLLRKGRALVPPGGHKKRSPE